MNTERRASGQRAGTEVMWVPAGPGPVNASTSSPAGGLRDYSPAFGVEKKATLHKFAAIARI